MTTQILPKAADAAHLTEVLHRAGVLGEGRVCEVTVERDWPTILSRFFRLRLTYDGAASGAPGSLLIKSCHPDRVETFWFAGAKEVAFYSKVAPHMPAGIVPRCYEAVADEPGKTWHLLLEDLEPTHLTATIWPLPPTQTQCESIVRALARVHAAWWDDPRLGTEIGRLTSAAERADFLQRFERTFAKFCDQMGARLPNERRVLFERLIGQGSDLFSYRDRVGHVTIAHGDTHMWNVLLPRDGVNDGARWFDWDAWSVDPAALDLAYMIAMHWYPDRRKRLEQTLLDHYHAELVARGVAGYSREMLNDDYRLSVLLLIVRPVWQWANNIPPVIWWNNLERILLAVDDLDCRAFLK